MPLRGSGIIHWLLNRFGVRLRALRFSYASYMTSRVPGIRRMVPFFEFPLRMGLDKAEKILRPIQESYELSDIYLFTSASCISGLALSTFQFRRAAKIVRASGSRDYGSLLKYRRQYFRVGERADSAGCVIEPAPVFARIIPCDEAGSLQYVSRPHADLLRTFHVPLRSYPNAHGKGDVVMTHTIREH